MIDNYSDEIKTHRSCDASEAIHVLVLNVWQSWSRGTNVFKVVL